MATSEKKVAIKFTRNYVVDDERKGSDEEEAYKKGQRKFFVRSSAEHFVNRGAAEFVKKADKS